MSEPEGPASQETLRVSIEFSGGLDVLFRAALRSQIVPPSPAPSALTVPLPPPHTMRHLIAVLRPLASPPDLFAAPEEGGYMLRAGVLAVVGDEDWEVREPSGMDCIIGKGEGVAFISTLHGG